MSSQRILDKIQKLMRLVKRGNPHESANALAKVQALMKAHQLTQSDVDLSTISDSRVKAANASKKPPVWSCELAFLVRDAMGVEVVLQFGNGAYVRFIGEGERAEVAGYVYTVLSRKLAVARHEYRATLDKRLKPASRVARADLFCEGWCVAVRKKVQAIVPTEREQGLVAAYIEREFSTTRGLEARAPKFKATDRRAAVDGYIAGNAVELNAGVAGGKAPERLGGVVA